MTLAFAKALDSGFPGQAYWAVLGLSQHCIHINLGVGSRLIISGALRSSVLYIVRLKRRWLIIIPLGQLKGSKDVQARFIISHALTPFEIIHLDKLYKRIMFTSNLPNLLVLLTKVSFDVMGLPSPLLA
jgi:hypothetical protein